MDTFNINKIKKKEGFKMTLTELKQNIANDINMSGLSIDAVYFVMKDLMNEVVMLYNQQKDAEAAASVISEPDSEVTEEPVAAQDEKKEE